MTWILYGATGYTGGLTARLAKSRGMTPILACRNETKLRALAAELGFEYRVFGLDDSAQIRANLEDVDALVHHAGPFSATSSPMVEACLATKTHYLDITGEISVFEAIRKLSDRAENAGVVLLPGVGFDVVPTDCLAGMLHRELPDANQLVLGFASLGGGPSKGTSKTIVESLGTGGMVRINGALVDVPSAWKVREIPFPSKTRTAASIPWGDVSTAYQTTGIGNITVFMAIPEKMIPWMKVMDKARGLLQTGVVQRLLKKAVEHRIQGPSDLERARSGSEVWGEVSNASGDRVSGTLRTPDGYTLTADSSLLALTKVLAGGVKPGAHTPSTAFGVDYVKELEGVEVLEFRVH